MPPRKNAPYSGIFARFRQILPKSRPICKKADKTAHFFPDYRNPPKISPFCTFIPISFRQNRNNLANIGNDIAKLDLSNGTQKRVRIPRGAAMTLYPL